MPEDNSIKSLIHNILPKIVVKTTKNPINPLINGT